MAAHLAFHLGEYAFALRQCQKAFENKASVPAVQQEDLLVDTIQDFFSGIFLIFDRELRSGLSMSFILLLLP